MELLMGEHFEFCEETSEVSLAFNGTKLSKKANNFGHPKG